MAMVPDPADEMTLGQAANSGAASSSDGAVGMYVTVSFDDGAETGLTALTSEDDLCDPRYWRFQEVHGSTPKFKVLFNDGFTSFLTALPSADDGVVVDEDGDEHRYVKISQLPETQETELGKANLRRAPGGYGFIEVVEDVPLTSESQKKRPLKAAATGGSAKRRKTAGSKKVDAPAEKTSEGGRTPVAAADAAEGIDLGGPSLADAGEEGVKAPVVPDETVSRGPAAPSMSSGAQQGDPGTKAESTAEGSTADSAAVEGQGASAKANVEKAKTGRSVCRTCGGGIEKGAVRCGLQGYAGGRSVLLWAHANCFMGNLLVDYVLARRGRCKGTGEAFEIGQARVGFEVGNHKSWWLPTEAARWTSEVIRLSGSALTTLRGIEELEESHRNALLELLKSGRGVSNSQLKTSKVPSKSKRAPKVKKDKAAEAAEVPTQTTAAEAPAEATDSDVELNFDEPQVQGRVPLDLDESE